MESGAKAKIGFIGLGLMGRPMAANLLKAGHAVTVWNRTAARADELVAAGAKLAKSPAAAASEADVLITIVSDPPALEEVLWGKSGGVSAGDAALAALKPGAIYIDSSTVSPDLGAKHWSRHLFGEGREISGCAGDRRRLGREEGRACFYGGGRGGDAKGGRAGDRGDGEEVVSARTERGGADDQAGDELYFGATDSGVGRGAGTRYGSGAEGRGA